MKILSGGAGSGKTRTLLDIVARESRKGNKVHVFQRELRTYILRETLLKKKAEVENVKCSEGENFREVLKSILEDEESNLIAIDTAGMFDYVTEKSTRQQLKEFLDQLNELQNSKEVYITLQETPEESNKNENRVRELDYSDIV